jgi:hypothetical protein
VCHLKDKVDKDLATSPLPSPVHLNITEIDIPILVKIKYDQRTPQRRIQKRESQAQKRAHYCNHNHTITTPIDGKIEDKE